MSKQTKYIVVTGGVLSGLGKGVTTASIGFFFSDNYNVVPIKLDGYLNSDPGTMNPIEHGEVFVLDDGFEVDMDFGHYERYLGNSASKIQSLTMGKVFKNVRLKERKGDYLGKTVQMVPHVTNFIQDYILDVADQKDADIVLVEIGGTIGDLENELFVEAMRQLERRVGQDNIIFIHLTYVPVPFGVNEQKTKPTQQSVSLLHNRGVWPAIIIARCNDYLTDHSREKIALFSNIPQENVFTAPDLNSVYELPKVLHDQKLLDRVCAELDLPSPSLDKLNLWSSIFDKKQEGTCKVLIAGKYTGLEDSYASVVESLKHVGYNLGVKIDIEFLETSEKINYDQLKRVDAIIVPGAFGSRGVEGKIEVIKYARENNVPYLGICYGLQLAVIEYARNVLGIEDATSMEINPDGENVLVTLLDEQKKVVKIGGTMRLGSYDAVMKKDSIIEQVYRELGLTFEEGGETIVKERHRHRYEVNPEFSEQLEKGGLVISGKSKERDLVEFIELDSENHPYFVATQAHPELKSKVEKPAPLFYGLIRAAMNFK